MPQIKSAMKRVEVTKTKTAINKSTKTKIATQLKKVKTAIAANDIVKAEEEYKATCKALDQAASANVIHAKYADRRKAHYAKLISDAKVAK